MNFIFIKQLPLQAPAAPHTAFKGGKNQSIDGHSDDDDYDHDGHDLGGVVEVAAGLQEVAQAQAEVY